MPIQGHLLFSNGMSEHSERTDLYLIIHQIIGDFEITGYIDVSIVHYVPEDGGNNGGKS
jgi:hypothetical protein